MDLSARWNGQHPPSFTGTIEEARAKLELYMGMCECRYHDAREDYTPLYDTSNLLVLQAIARQYEALYLGVFQPWVRSQYGLYWPDVDRKIRPTTAPAPDAVPALDPPETLTALLADQIPPPLQLAEGLLHEGMLLFGGKSKRGKSWLMFDLALSLALGRAALRHFPCPQARPVLYLALEDGRGRLQGRARLIQPNLMTADRLHLRYSFPPLAEGGIAAMAREIETYKYGLVVIDVLARLEQAARGPGEKSYHEVYEMFSPLQELRRHTPFCLAMLTHLRKQEADDVFDNLHGSVAYQGAQDVLWVLERKPKDDFAFLHVRDKDTEDRTFALRFLDGHWEYIGEGEEYQVSRDQRRVAKVLTEEKREMTLPEIQKALDFSQAKYGYLRKLLSTMVQDDLVHRTKHGRYTATLRGAVEMIMDENADYDDEVFRSK